MAKLYFRYGAMGSSKTANAIMVQYNYHERGQEVLMVKPRLDNRDGERTVMSRCGLKTECVFMEELTDAMVQGTGCVIVDEAQFLTKDQVSYRCMWWTIWACPSSLTASVRISRAISLREASG